MQGKVKIIRRLEDNHLGTKIYDFDQKDKAEVFQTLSRLTDLVEVEIEGCDLKDDDAKAITAFLPKNPQLTKLVLLENFIGPEGVEALAEAAPSLPLLQEVNLARNMLFDREGGEAVAKLLRNAPRIRELNVSSNQLKDEGSAVLAQALKDSPHLEKIFAADLNNTDAGLQALVEGVHNHPSLRSVNLMQERHMTARLPERTDIVHVLAGSETRNLTLFTPRNEAVEAFCANNKELARQAATHLKGDMAALDYQTTAALMERWPAINEHMGFFQPPLETTVKSLMFQRREFPEFISGLPRVPQDGKVDSLFAADAQGYAPLDNPLLWRKPEMVAAYLDKAGQKLTPEFLARETPRGVSFRDSALMAAPLSRLIPAFNQRGLRFGEAVLLQPDGKPTELFSSLIERGGAAALFTRENWRGSHPDTMRRAAACLPEEQRAHIPMHTLATALALDMPQTARGR